MAPGRIDTADADVVESVARRLAEASRVCTPMPPVREELRAGGIPAAYAVQQANVARRVAAGARVVGRKIGLTSPAVQRQLGVDQPDFGALLSDMNVPHGATVPAGVLIQPKIEAEVALVLSQDLPYRDCTEAQVAAAVDVVLPALEIVDSRIEGWDITILDTVADNASSALFVLGDVPVPLGAVDLRDVVMTLTRDGVEVSSGKGTDCLDGPLTAAAWLASTLAEAGDPLRAGDIVLTGALGPMAVVTPGDVYEAVVTGVGAVRVAFARR